MSIERIKQRGISMRLTSTDTIAGGLSIVGALNWGLVGLFNFNLVHFLFGWSKPLERIVYATVGVSGVFAIFSLLKFMNEPHSPEAEFMEHEMREPLHTR
jgi:uncharacterized protein